MGVARKQDEALTLYQILLFGGIAEKDWVQSNYEEEKKELESKTAFAITVFCMYLQG